MSDGLNDSMKTQLFAILFLVLSALGSNLQAQQPSDRGDSVWLVHGKTILDAIAWCNEIEAHLQETAKTTSCYYVFDPLNPHIHNGEIYIGCYCSKFSIHLDIEDLERDR